MIAFWNRTEIYAGTSAQDFLRLRNLLDEAGIRHTYKIVSDNSAPGFAAAFHRSTMYYVYVHRKDADRAAGIPRAAR